MLSKNNLLFYLFLNFMPITGIYADKSIENTFTEIYQIGAWGVNAQGIGHSGCGSTYQNVYPYLQFLENFIKMNNITKVLDVGCGDWTFSQHMNWKNVEYTGIDIVKNVIEKNQASFETENIKFFHHDLTTENLPAAELLICKDVLQHLSNENIIAFFKKTDDFKHLIITNDVDPNSYSSTNPDILNGDHRFLDLTKEPFNIDGIKLFVYQSGGVIKQVLYIKK